MQAPRFECLSFDPLPLFQNGFVASEVDVSGYDVVDALMEALMIVVVDEGFDPHWPALTAPRSLTRLHSDAHARGGGVARMGC